MQNSKKFCFVHWLNKQLHVKLLLFSKIIIYECLYNTLLNLKQEIFG